MKLEAKARLITANKDLADALEAVAKYLRPIFPKMKLKPSHDSFPGVRSSSEQLEGECSIGDMVEAEKCKEVLTALKPLGFKKSGTMGNVWWHKPQDSNPYEMRVQLIFAGNRGIAALIISLIIH